MPERPATTRCRILREVAATRIGRRQRTPSHRVYGGRTSRRSGSPSRWAGAGDRGGACLAVTRSRAYVQKRRARVAYGTGSWPARSGSRVWSGYYPPSALLQDVADVPALAQVFSASSLDFRSERSVWG